MKYTLVKCANCNKELFILEAYVRDLMFCTIGCMEKSSIEQASLIYGTKDDSTCHKTPSFNYISNTEYMINDFQDEGADVISGILPLVSEYNQYQHDPVLISNE